MNSPKHNGPTSRRIAVVIFQTSSVYDYLCVYGHGIVRDKLVASSKNTLQRHVRVQKLLFRKAGGGFSNIQMMFLSS